MSKWVNAHVNNFLIIPARELNICVCYIQEKSAPLTNFQVIGQLEAKLPIFVLLFSGTDKRSWGHMSSFKTSPAACQCSAF